MKLAAKLLFWMLKAHFTAFNKRKLVPLVKDKVPY